MADISNIVTVQLRESGSLIGKFNMNSVAIITSDNSFLSTIKRTKIYKTLKGVTDDFGTTGQEASFATTFFAQSPNPISAGGYLVMGYHRANEENVPATYSKVIGGQLSTSVIKELRKINSGAFNIMIGEDEVVRSGIDFRLINTLEEIPTAINAIFNGNGIFVSYENKRIIFTATIVGKTLEKPTLHIGNEQQIVDLLKLTDEAELIQTTPQETLPAETPTEGVTACLSENRFAGFMLIDDNTDASIKTLSNYAQAQSILYYEIFSSANSLKNQISNVVYEIRTANNSNTRMIYSKKGNRKLATAYMSRVHTTIFSGENTTITAHLKELTTIESEKYDESEVNNAKNLGLEIYTDIRGLSKILSSGANDWFDNRYNLISLIDAIKVDLFNLLTSTSAKVPQTTKGISQITDRVRRTLNRYVVNGFLSGGNWTLPDFFGNVEVFKRSVSENGYYVLARPLSEQAQDDREARKSPVIQIAIKSAGAIHSVQAIVNFNE